MVASKKLEAINGAAIGKAPERATPPRHNKKYEHENNPADFEVIKQLSINLSSFSILMPFLILLFQLFFFSLQFHYFFL